MPSLLRQTVALLLAVAAPPPRAQAPAAPDAPPPALSDAARGRALARLVDAYKGDEPARALAYGAEALRIFARMPDDSAHVATLDEMAWAYMTLAQYDSAVAYAERGRRLAERAGQRPGLARAISNLGTIAQRRGDPLRAVELFEEALVVQREIGAPREIANSLNNLGFVYSTDLAEYGVALDYHLEARRLRDPLRDTAAIALSLNNIGIVYGRLRQYDLALAYFDSALVLRRAQGSTARVAATLSNIGDMYQERGAYARALAPHRESLRLRRQVGDRSAIALAHRNLGVAYLALGQLDSAHAELTEALRIGDEVGDRGLAVRNLLGLAAVERARGRLATAEATTRRALAVAEAMPSRELARQAWEALAAVQEARGAPAAALASYKRFKALSDSIFDDNTSRRVAGLERRFSEERREHELAHAQRQEALALLAAERRAVQRNGVIAIGLLVGLVGLARYRRRAERARMAEELSMTDALTGARNRRFLQQTIAMDVAASVRRHRVAAERGLPADDADLVFYLVDLDHFKRINDEHGHAAGDRLLVELTRVLQAASRESDVVVRWGGEEFLVLGRFTDREQAAQQAERLRAAVEAHTTVLEGGRVLRATCSIGYAVFPFVSGDPDALAWEEVVSLADHGTYAAKRLGRNAWAGYVPGDGAPPTHVLHATQRQIDGWVAEGRLRCESSDERLTAVDA
ncbi:MAG TPA: tetratricopeptide repeat-containing diguanylate cyclase [Gemmatimonadaceae bacterium]|nr:tetratricopeptide repeat-containing diguanylate cyclase [Gemmatimonadaceae bacterium]